ncbi:MAG: hypothetical protein E7Z70_00565 [Thermoplasmata archaeon]|nr:hypothetical protein [Thermoplasmata archaeon]MBO5547144.1 hypothetical protein [Candidatus Methanomethylophilaceae archaeon]MBR4684909.1 hypothetical protein [Candidatus Methanomethylophilaceae archaeon]WII07698.1 hypothetical protein PED39_00440 [Methanomassiliicoccales archaeon LGM-RCC1]
MSNDFDPNAGLFGEPEPEKSPEEILNEYSFGKNPNRAVAIETLFGKRLMDETMADDKLPVEGKMSFVFKATVHGVLDMIMESLQPEYREEVATSLDSFIGLNLVNQRFGVDLVNTVMEELSKIEPQAGESDDMFEKRLMDMEEAWWNIPQPLLNGRNPNDAIREEMNKYGLNQ